MSVFNRDSCRRIVIKVGSSLLIGADEQLDRGWLKGLSEDIAVLRQQGCDVLIVSSGAIAIGSRILSITNVARGSKTCRPRRRQGRCSSHRRGTNRWRHMTFVRPRFC